MQFEVFQSYRFRSAHEAAITIQRSGLILVNRAAMELLVGSERPRKFSIELLFSKDNQVVALRLAGPNSSNPHTLRRQGNYSGYLVAAISFLRHYSIDNNESRRYEARTYGTGIVGVDLRGGYETVSRERKRKRGNA